MSASNGSDATGSAGALAGAGTARLPSLLLVRNCQRSTPVNVRLLRRIIRCVLRDGLQREVFDLAFYLVGPSRMTQLNETFLRHAGSTDVITFDYADPAPPPLLHGEIFVCVDEAKRQARKFRTTWQCELVRYVIHGTLHLAGYDDLRPAAKRVMKREEDRLVRYAGDAFALTKLGGAGRPRSPGGA